jgi:hypothetical protein
MTSGLPTRFEIVKWRGGGLTRDAEQFADGQSESRQQGVRGETFAYWYLRRQGHVFVARNYILRGGKEEIDLLGYDGETLCDGAARKGMSDAL